MGKPSWSPWSSKDDGRDPMQELLDHLVEAVELLQERLPVLRAHATAWKRGYAGSGLGGTGGGSGESTTQRLATSAQADPAADIAELERGVRSLVRDGVKLAERSGHLMPLDPDTARKAAEAMGPVCRLHVQVGVEQPVYVSAEGLCRTCYDFKREQGGGTEDEPPLWIVQRWADGKKVYNVDIKRWREEQRQESAWRGTTTNAGRRRDR